MSLLWVLGNANQWPCPSSTVFQAVIWSLPFLEKETGWHRRFGSNRGNRTEVFKFTAEDPYAKFDTEAKHFKLNAT